MEILKNLILKKRDIKPITIRNYFSVYRSLMKKRFDTLQEFFENWRETLELVKKNYKISTQANLTTAMIVGLDAIHEHLGNPDLEEGLKQYRNHLLEIKPQLEMKKWGETKSPQEEKNWATIEELQKEMVKKEKMAKKIIKRGGPISWADIKILQSWLITTLYVGSEENPPLRNDYGSMLVISAEDYKTQKKPDTNYLVIHSTRTKYFVLQEYKTFKTHGIKSIKLSPIVNRAVNAYLKIKDLYMGPKTTDTLFFSQKGMVPSAPTMSINVQEAFHGIKKHITINLIRHIFISNIIKNKTLLERKKISEKMCHNLEMQLSYNKL